MSQFSRRQAAVKVMALLWVPIIVVAFYVVHKPFDIANVVALGRALGGLLSAGLVVALGTGVGSLLLRQAGLVGTERLISAAAVGLGVVSLLGLGLGVAGLLRPWLLWALTIAGLAATARPFWRALQDACWDLTWRPQGRFEALLAGYCGLILLVSLIWAVTPPTAWDGLVYHLTGPRLYLVEGHISHPIDLPYLGFPQLTEMLFTWGMGMVGERAAAPIHWFFGVLTALALVAAGRRWFDGPSGWLAAAILLSARTMVFLILYSTLGFLSLARWVEDGSRKWLTLSGVFAGLGLSTKYTAIALLPALSIALFVFQSLGGRGVIRNLRSTIRHSLLLCAVALLVWSPWLAKNLLLTGNPMYPFFFDGIHWDDWRGWWYDRPGTGLAYTAPHRLLTAPWDATIWGVEGGVGYEATSGPLFLAVLPMLGLAWQGVWRRERRWLWAAGAFCGVLYGFWLWGVARTALLRQTRLLFPAFGILALMAGAAVDKLRALPGRSLDLGWIVRVIIALVLAFTLVGTVLFTVREQPLQVLLGFESREDFLMRRLGWYYSAVKHINEHLPQDSKVLFLWEPRTYHCELDCQPDALLDRWLHTLHLYGRDSDAIADAWRAEGITHVLLHRAGLNHVLNGELDPITSEDLETLDALTASHLSLMKDFGSAYELYRLERKP
jgi:hypothetical protein